MSDEIKGREHVVARQQALGAVFKRFAAIWPRAFAPSHWDGLMEPWLDALKGVPTDALEPAAREILRDGNTQYPPKPWELAKRARAIDRATRPDRPAAPADTWDLFAKAKPFRYAKPGADTGYGRLDGDNAIAFVLRSGGSLGISEFEMDRIHARELDWSWMAPEDVPMTAAPTAFFRSWSIALPGSAA